MNIKLNNLIFNIMNLMNQIINNKKITGSLTEMVNM